MPRICFFAPVRDRTILDRVEFYHQDITFLRELGHDVCIATRWREIPYNSDLYFVWWWTWAFLPLIKARLSRKPTLITGTFADIGFNDRPLWERVLMVRALRMASANIFVSKLERTVIGDGLSANEPGYSPHSVDPHVYAVSSSRRDEFILSVAWLGEKNVRRKGIPQLIESMPQILQSHPGMRLLIAGEKGGGYPVLEETVLRLGLADHVAFLGVISLHDKVRLMQQATLYVQPSVYEGFGLAVAEAMSCGATVVTTRAGALAEVVGDAGVLLADNCPSTVADAILELLDDPRRQADLGTRAAERIRRYFSPGRRKRDLGTIIDRMLA